MTTLLERAFAEANKLPDDAQDRLAVELLRDLADEAKWEQAFAGSPAVLERLASEAMAEYRAGHTDELGFDEL